MKYDLVRVSNKSPKLMWEMKVTFVHGDADAYDSEKIKFEDEYEFFEKAKILKDRLDYKRKNHNAAINSNEAWAKGHEEWIDIPWDVTSGHNYRASIDRVDCFYYDEDGVKFRVVFEK